MSNTKSILLVTVSLLLTFDALAERQWPDRVFDCQVVTITGAQGLVSVQSLSPEDASKGAVGLAAVTLLGEKGTADRVMQCIERRKGEKFTDSNFQAWFEKFDQ